MHGVTVESLDYMNQANHHHWHKALDWDWPTPLTADNNLYDWRKSIPHAHGNIKNYGDIK
jgi:hypothetical protein